MSHNWSFSVRIAKQFRDKYSRASHFFSVMYNTNTFYSAKIFYYDQKRWELYKKCVIQIDRLILKADYSPARPEDIELLKQKVRHMMSPVGPDVTKLPKNGI